MKLENQVVNLELSKKLKKLGVKQESLWWWFNYQSKKHLFHKNSPFGDRLYSAFTVAELGEMLPSHIVSWRVDKKRYICKLLLGGDTDIIADTEANVRCHLLIYLIENKLMKL